jgi:3-oxoacyl-[acyl-carrier-protein] synthase-3
MFLAGRAIQVPYAAIGSIAVHLPARVETNDELQSAFPDWDLPLIAEKTGIYARHIAAPNETASDLAVAACEQLFSHHEVDRKSVDFLLLCTQTPDYPLPTTACLLQDRLQLPISCGALDFNLGCSGFVYGLALADGLIQSGAARRILLVTAETYSKYIDPADRSLRTIFGDGAAATVIEAVDQRSLWGFQFGTDGSGADTLLVQDGGARQAGEAIKPRHRKRWASRLYMDGPSLINFTIDAVPHLIQKILQANQLPLAEIDLLLLHQATRKMLEQLQMRLEVDSNRLPIELSETGNTVSATLPLLIAQQRRLRHLSVDRPNLLVGFGVGWSWAGCLFRDLLGPGR